MDSHYISFISDSLLTEDGLPLELLRVFPVEMRRQFAPIFVENTDSTSVNQWKLVYSHTDTLVRLYRPDGPAIQLDGVEAILNNSDDAFGLIVQPANVHIDDVSFNMNELKRLVLWLFPEIQVKNVYQNRPIATEGPIRTAVATPTAMGTRYVPRVPIQEIGERFHIAG
jgi:hypothetical protein